MYNTIVGTFVVFMILLILALLLIFLDHYLWFKYYQRDKSNYPLTALGFGFYYWWKYRRN